MFVGFNLKPPEVVEEFFLCRPSAYK